MIYHISSRGAWQAAQGRGWYSAPSLASEGFIHCSRREQLRMVATDFYRGAADLLLLCIDEDRLRAELRWEAPAHPRSEDAEATRGEALFPHVYGRVNLDAILKVVEFTESEDGFRLPPDLP